MIQTYLRATASQREGQASEWVHQQLIKLKLDIRGEKIGVHQGGKQYRTTGNLAAQVMVL